jgi:peroxin-5
MEAAFEQALADARAQTQTEAQSTTTTTATDDKQEEEGTREAKGDFDAVWESLRPEAERLNKLAEWENDFSQVCFPFDPKQQGSADAGVHER